MKNKYILLTSVICIIATAPSFASGPEVTNAGTINIDNSFPKSNVKNNGTLNMSTGELLSITNTGTVLQSGGKVNEVTNSGEYTYSGGDISQFTQQDEGKFNVNSDLTISGNFDLKKGASTLAEGTTINIINKGILDVDISKTHLNGTVNVEKGAMNVFGCNSETEHTLKHTDDEATTNINNSVETNIPEAPDTEEDIAPTMKLGKDCEIEKGTLNIGTTPGVDASGTDDDRRGAEDLANYQIYFDGKFETGNNKTTFYLGDNADFHILENGKVTLDGGDSYDKVRWYGDIYLDGGKLTLRNIIDDSAGTATVNKHGELIAYSGDLTLEDGVVLNEHDTIEDAVNLTIKGSVTVGPGATIHVSGADLKGANQLNIEGGRIFISDVETDEDTHLSVTTGSLTVKKDTVLKLNNDSDNVTFDVDLDLKGSLEINNNNPDGVCLNNIGTNANENWEQDITLKKGKLTLENVEKQTTDDSKYIQNADGDLQLFKTQMTLNKGSEIKGGKITFGVKLESPTPPMLLRAPTRRLSASGIKLRADSDNNNTVILNNGVDNNTVIQDNGTQFQLGVTGKDVQPTTLTIEENSILNNGILTAGDGSNENVINIVNSTLTKNVSFKIKDNATINISGINSDVTINMDNHDTKWDGTLAWNGSTNNGTAFTIIGKGNKSGVFKFSGDNLIIGDETTETELNLENDNDKISGDELLVTQNVKLKSSGSAIDAPVTNKGEIRFSNASISHQISVPVPVVFMGGAGLRADDAYIEPTTGTVRFDGQNKVGADIKQENINVEDNGSLDTTGELSAKKISLTQNSKLASTNSRIIASELDSDYTSNLSLNNADLIINKQTSDVNGQIDISGDSTLAISNQKFSGLVNVKAGANANLVSGQIGATTIERGARITVGAVAIQAPALVNYGQDRYGYGILLIEKTDKVYGDIILQNGGHLEICDQDIVFDEYPTYQTQNTGPYLEQQNGGVIIIQNARVQVPMSSIANANDVVVQAGAKFIVAPNSKTPNSTFYFKDDFYQFMDGKYRTYTVNNEMKFGSADSQEVGFKVDLYARSSTDNKYDSFGSNTAKITAQNGSSATVKILDWQLNGDLFGADAPIDDSITMPIFKYSSVENGHKIEFTATDKEVLTAIGYYRLNAKEHGSYALELTRYNPIILRGQIALTAQNQNQLTINDTVFEHTMTNDNYLPNSKNKYLWGKLYGGKEKLNMATDNTRLPTQDLTHSNKTYGTIIGLDFDEKKFENGWKFTPTIYANYNYAKQVYGETLTTNNSNNTNSDDAKSDNLPNCTQHGVQFGFATNVTNDKVVFGGMVYGGRYSNDMSITNEKSEKINNYFSGASMKVAYNVSLHQNVILQPNCSVTYNHFGGARWNSDYGQMDMQVSSLNGLNMTFGTNIIFSSKNVNALASVQYVHGFKQGVTGKAGNVNLSGVKLNKGYMQYGLGIQGKFSERLSGNLQGVVRHLGRTGFGVQVGISYKFK